MPNNNIKKVYDAMSAKYNMEEPYEVFEKNMTDGENRKAVYDALTQKYNMLDSFEDFEKYLGITDSAVPSTFSESAPEQQAQATQQNVMQDTAGYQKGRGPLRPQESAQAPVMPQTDTTPIKAEGEPTQAENAPDMDTLDAQLAQEQAQYDDMLKAEMDTIAAKYPTQDIEKIQGIADSMMTLRGNQRYIPSSPEEGKAVADVIQAKKKIGDLKAEGAAKWAKDHEAEINAARQMKKDARKKSFENFLIMNAAGQSAALSGGNPNASGQYMSQATEAAKTYSDNKAIGDMLQEAIQYADNAVAYSENGGKGALGRGFIDSAARISTWDLGYSDVVKNATIASIFDRLDKGETLSEEEEAVMDALALANTIQRNTQDAAGIGYNVGASLPQSLGFMASLYLNPASGLGRKAMTKAIRKYGKRWMAKSARYLGDIAEMGVATATSGGMRTAGAVLDKMNGEANFVKGSRTPEGEEEYIYMGQEGRKKASEAIVKGFLSQFIENWTEATGEYMRPVLSKTGKVIGEKVFDPMFAMLGNITKKGLKKGGLNSLTDAISRIPKTEWGKMMKAFKDRVKWNGPISEILEEEVGMTLEPLLADKGKRGEAYANNFGIFSKDKETRERARETQITTALSCAFMSGAFMAVDAVGLSQVNNNGNPNGPTDDTNTPSGPTGPTGGTPAPRATWMDRLKVKKNLWASERECLRYMPKQEFEQLKAQLDEAEPEEMVSILKDYIWQGGIDDDLRAKYAILNYACSLVEQQAFNATTVEAREEMSDISNSMYDAYLAGTSMASRQDVMNYRNVSDGYYNTRNRLQEYDQDNGTSLYQTAESLVNANDAEIENVMNGLNDNEKQLVEDFLNYASVWHGLYDGIENRDLFYNQEAYLLPAMVTDADGNETITTATTAEGEPVYVTGTQGSVSYIIDKEGNKTTYPTSQLSDVQTSPFNDVVEALTRNDYDNAIRNFRFYTQHNPKTQEPQIGMVIGDGNTNVIVTDMGKGWATIQETMIDPNTGQAVVDPNSPSRDVSISYLLALQDDIYDKRDEMDKLAEENETENGTTPEGPVAEAPQAETPEVQEPVAEQPDPLQEQPQGDSIDNDVQLALQFIAAGDNDYLNMKIEQAEKELDEANKAKPTITDDDAARLAQLQGINDRKAAAQANYDHWKEVERRVNDILNPRQEEQPQAQNNPVEESVKSNYTTRTPQFEKDGFDDDEVSQTIDAARAGDQEAIQKLADYGIKYGATGTIYRYISKGEYDAIMSGKRYMGRSGDGRVDVTNNSNPSTGASTEYRVTFKPQYDMDKNDGRTRMKNAELGDGFMMDGYGLHEVQSIEKMNPDGTYTTVYSAEQQESPIQAKFNGGNPIVGREDVYILPNGTEINGHYVIVEQDALTPSHDASFRPIPEYGTNENGSTLNDRDYEHDKDAQAVEKQKAQNYDKRAYQEPVVVTPDGRVFSGNGRTISGMIAAENGTDTKYVNSLKRDARFYGFEDGAVDGYNHPRLVFVVDDDIPFTSDNIAMFNADSRKTQNKTERMVKAGKVLSDAQYEKLARIVEDYDTLDDLYNKGAARLMRTLQDEGIINPNDVAQYMEGDQLSQMGRDYVEGLLIGYALNGSDDSVRMLMSDGMGNVRKSFMYALRQVVANRTLGEYALNKEIEEAIEICYEAHRKFGGNVDGYLRQKSIFGDTLADRTQELSQMFSTFMNSGSAALRDVIDVYNNSYTDELAQENMFGERDRESAINDIINYINNKYGQTGSAQTSNRGSGQQTSGSSEENQPAEQGGTGVADVAATGNGINEQDIRTGAAEEGPQSQEEVKTGPVGTVREITNSRTGEPAWIVEGDIDEGELDALRKRAKLFGGYYTNRGGVRGFVFTNEEAANQFNDRAVTEYTATAQEQPTTGDNGDIYSVAQQVADERGGVTRNESEIEDQMPILTREEVLNSGAEQDDIDAALDYLDGDRGLQAQIGYKKVSDYVRSKQGGAEQVGTTEGQSQLVGTDNGTNGPEQAGRSGVESGSVGEEGNGGNVSELGIRGENGAERTTTDNGEGGNSEPASEGRGPVSSTADGGRRAGSRSDGRDGRNVRGGRREATGNADTTEDTGRGTDTESGGNNSLEGQLDDLKGLFDDWKKAGRNGTLNASIIGMNNEQIEILGKILKKSIQIGATLIQKGVHTLSSFANAMRKYIGDSLKSIFGYSDQEVDDFINECWNSKVTINGERKRLCEFASEMGDEDLRKELKKTLAEKRKEQADAEKIEETIICDEDNIRATLPYLLPEQRHDVYLAETQFFTEEHADREHGYGKGYMFTNGTGTGKTYTGLGIMKRFIRQGKTRILVLTPTQEKVTDWVNDARNLQLQLTRLDNTQDAGTGAVITTYANFRANQALMKDDFDLVVYDESHRIIENKFGEETTGAQQHYMVTNRNDEAAYDRLTQNNPVWIRGKEIDETLKLLNKDLTNAEYDGESDDKIADLQQKIRELEQEQKDNQEQKQQLEPDLRKRAAEAAKRTKVVFLSATPFNTAMGLEYAEGYIFSYPEEEAAENNAEDGTQPTDKKKSKKSARETFLLDTFGSSYRYKNGRLAMDFTNPVAAAQEEIGFSDMLQNVLHTMSGRIIDSEYDYSRDFPEIKLQQSFAFNGALGDLQNDPVISPIAKYFGYLDDYNWFGYIIESIKVHEFIPRIKEHLARGRQVVIFHRRQNETKSNKLPPAGPPFAIGLMQAAAATQDQNLPRQERELIQRGIDEFMTRYSALLDWEQKLDYRPVVEQISEAFATDKDREEYQKKLQDWQKKYDKAMAEGKNPPRMPKLTASMVGYFSGEETKNAKHNDVLSFNSDEGDKQIIVVQESSGKEGISLHDTTGKKQRVLMSLALPQSPITFIQQEGRIYRIGNRSNAIFEYPLIGIAKELNLFAGYFNTRAETTENLALGSKGRGLRDAIKRGIMERRGVIPLDGQGIGGKEFDKRIVSDLHKGYEGAIARFKDKTINWGDEQGEANIDDFPTPEPIAFKMVEWAQIEKGENVLEPSAGEGQILRYIPETVETKFLEPSQDKGSMLNVEFSSNIKSLDQHTFENYNVVNKHDVIIMAPPSGVGANTAFKHMNKAFKHLNEGGRMVILVPEGDNFNQRMTEFMTENPTSMVTANINLPECGLSYGGISLKTRALVIDKVSRRVARDKFNAHVEADLSDIKDIDTLFNELKNMKVPARKVDEIAKMMRIAKKFKTQFVKTGMIAKSSDGKEDMYWVTDDGVSFDTAHTKKTNIRGWFGFNFNNFRPTLSKNYGRNFTIVKDDYLGKEGDDFIRSTSNSYWNPYAPEKANEVRAFWEAYCDLIQELSGLTEAQIRRVSMGLSQEINVSDLGETVDMQSLSEKFDVAVKDSPNADIKRKLFKQVTAVAQTSGIKLSINHSNANDAGTYVLNEHGMYLNDRVWNRLDNNKRADVILHEFIHSVTTYALQMSEIEHKGFSSMAQMNAFNDTPLIIINTCHEIENIYNVIMHGIESSTFAGSYAINNPHEMMAELADDKTRDKYEARKVWYKEENGVRKYYGFQMDGTTESNALVELERALQTLLTEFDQNTLDNVIDIVNGNTGYMKTPHIVDTEAMMADDEFKNETDAENLATDFILDILSDRIIRVSDDEAMVEVINKANNFEMQAERDGRDVRENLNDGTYGNIQFLRDGSKIYGYRKLGKIYLTNHGINANSPVHEYTHIWASAMMKNNREGWNDIVRLLKGTDVWNEVVADENYRNLKTDDQIASEVLSRISGRENSQKVIAEAQAVIDSTPDMYEAARKQTLLNRLKEALNKFWNWVSTNIFHMRFNSVDEITDRILYDMIMDTDLNEEEGPEDDGGNRKQPIFISNAAQAVANAKQGKATPEQWLAILRNTGGLKAGEDKWIGLSKWLGGDWRKDAQMDIISQSNPAADELHTWVRSVDDIKTYDEATADNSNGFAPDYTKEDIDNALNSGKVVVYSSHPIENGVFVTPSKMEATNYAGDGKVYSKEVPLSDVAWIDEGQGQYAPVPKTLTKQDVLDYIAENAIQIEETDYVMVDEGDMERLYPDWNRAFVAEQRYNGMEDGFEWVIKDTDAAFKLFNENHGKNQKDADKDYEDDWDKVQEWANRVWLKALKENHSVDADRLQYTSEGVDNNREIALTIPTIESWNKQDRVHFGDAGDGRAIAWIRFGDTKTGETDISASMAIKNDIESKYGRADDFDKMTDEDAARWEFSNYIYRGKYASADNSRDFIRSTFGEDRADNIIRIFDELVERNGGEQDKVLLIDEIQSKRHQEGRKFGYRNESVNDLKRLLRKREDKLQAMISNISKEHPFDVNDPNWSDTVDKLHKELQNSKEYQDLLNEIEDLKNKINSDAVPDAPFDRNWPELAMKRMLRLAAEEGYDKLAWTSGEQQADRYGLQSKVDNISYYVSPDGEIDARAYTPDGNYVSLGKTWDDVEKYIGKELTERLKNGENSRTKRLEWGYDKDGKSIKHDYKVLEGDGLKVGGHGMKDFYDKMLVDFMNKYGKKWGVKVQNIELPNVERGKYKFHSIDITPEMRESVKQGQPMFQIVADQIKKAAKQNFGSAATSLNQVPAGFKKIDWVPFTTNLDLGGGRFDTATEYLKKQGVKNLVFDPYNRSAESNREIAKQVRDGGVDTSTCMNVLNVIDTPEARSNVILQCAKAIKKGGTSYFSVYEGDKSGVGRQTKSDSWQNNMPLKDYMDEVKAHFADVKMKNGLIIAKKPIIDENGPKSIWNMDASGNESIEFNIADENTNDVFNRAIEEYGITSSASKAGYMLPDGRYLDFSQGQDRRTQDHRNVGIAYEDTVDEKWKYMYDFMRRGAIRMKPESDGFEIAVEPTPEQRRTLRQFIASRDGNVMVDIYDPVEDETISAEYTDASPSMVLGEIDRYFREGIKPQGNEDYIRYREGDNDAEYMDAVNRGDMKAAQKMVDEAAKAAGYTIDAYHGTNSGDFNKFESKYDVYWFSGEDRANTYADKSGEFDNHEPKVYHTFLKMDNPLRVDMQGKGYVEEIDLGFIKIDEFDESGDRLAEYAQDNGYDGVIFDNFIDEGPYRDVMNDGKPETEYVVFSPSQIKSAETVVRDDEGNIIPLSQRFKPENDDIRFRDELPTDRRVSESSADFYKRIHEAYNNIYRDLVPTAIYYDGMKASELAKELNISEVHAKALISDVKSKPNTTLALHYPNSHRIIVIQRDDMTSARKLMTALFHENVHAFFNDKQRMVQEETMANDIKNLVREILPDDEIAKFDRLSKNNTREIIAYGISQFMDENKVDELYDALDGFGKNLLDDYLKSIRYDKEYEKERRNVGRYGENPSEDRPSSDRRHNKLRVLGELDRGAKRLADKLGYNVRLITSEDDLTDEEKARYGRRTKGWFDARTGDVYVYLPMASSLNDVKRTILHEVVGHKGLRKIIGASYDRYMDELYGRLPKREQERIRKMANDKYKGNISVAMDEYLAEFAENGLQKPSVWQIVKSYIRDLFSRLFDIELKPADIRYMLWRSQKAMRDDNYVDMAKDRKLRDIIFREDEEELETEAANIESAMKSAIRNDYEEAVNKALFRLRMSWQDSMLAAKKLIEKFGDRHVTIKDFENIWMAENRLSSQTTHDKNAYSKAFAIPLIEHLNKMAAMLGTRFKKVGNMLNMTSYMDTIRDILDYMMAEHGLERNDVFAMRDARKEFNTSDEYAKLRGDLDTAWRNYQNDPTDQHLEDIYNQTKQQADDEINKLYKKYRKNDYSGLTTMFGFEKDEVDDAEQKAKELINNFKQNVGQDAVDELWRLTNAATKETLRKVHDGGLISDDTYNEVSNMFQHYIPLRGFKEEVAEDVYNYIDHPKGPFNAPMQTAKGRYSVADNPIANILSMADSGISSANRNRLVGLTTLALTRNHPNDLLIENQVYLVKKTDANGNESWEVAIPDEIPNSAKPEEVEAAMAKFNEQMEQLVQADEEAAKQAKQNGQQYDRKYMRAKQSPNTKYFVNKKQLSEHHILVKENGRPVLLTVAGNPVLAQSINGKTEYNSEDNILSTIFGNLTRWMAAGMTQLNIDFIAPNFVRDFGQAADMVFVEDGFRHYLKFRKNQLKAVAMTPYLVARQHNDKLNMQKKYDRLYQQFIENGGPTGYERIMGSDAYKTQLLKEFRQLNRSAFSPVKWIQWYFKLIGFANEVAETSTRFAKFITSMDEGRSLNKSILDAKNVSTNFSKRGSFGVGVPLVKPEGGEEVSLKRIAQETKYLVEQMMEIWLPKMTRPMYAFLNASMQGLDQRLRGFGNKEMRTRAVVNTLYEIGLGLANSYLAYVILKSLFNSNGDGDDDDEKQNEKEINDAELFRSKGSYGMLPSYVKRQNIVLPVGDGKFICIPLGIEKRSFFGVGQLLGEMAWGEKNYTSKQVERELMDIMGDLMPINAFEEGGYGLSPTFLKPFKEAKHNQSWSGGHIWYDSDYNKDDPNWTKAYNGTNPILVGISKDLYEKFERDFHQGSMADINPAKVEYILEQTLSGRLRTFNQLYKIANSVKEDEQVRLQDVPILNRFYKQSTGKAYEHAVNNEFYENKEFCEKYLKGIANMEAKMKDYNLSNEEYSDLEHDYDAEVESNAYRTVMNFLDEYNRIIKRENKAYKKSGDDDFKDDQINQKARMNLEFYESMKNVLNE